MEDSLKYLEIVEDLLFKERIGRAYIWKLKQDIVLDKISTKDAINLNYAIELSSNEFTKDIHKSLKKIFEVNNDIIIGHLSIIEELKNNQIAKNFDLIKFAIQKRKYLYLELLYSSETKFYDVKPIRLIFMDNNWYLAFEYFDKIKNQIGFRLARLSFINKIEFLKDKQYSNKNRFQTKKIQRYIEWLNKDMQNAFTFFGAEIKTATIQADKDVSHYFQKNMKKFFPTQKFKTQNKDGSIIFTINYTNPFEILPFIQKWLPYLKIIKPQELKDEYIKKLKQAIKSL